MYIEEYPQEAYDLFIKGIKGHRKAFRELLKDYPEWAAFANAIRGDEKALNWLFKHQFPEFGILANAIDDEKQAMVWLEKYPDPFLKHFAAATKNEMLSKAWLKIHSGEGFYKMAEIVREVMLVRIKEESFWYRIKW